MKERHHSPGNAAFFLKPSRHWRLAGFPRANLLFRYQNSSVMRTMKSPMAVRKPSTSGDTATRKHGSSHVDFLWLEQELGTQSPYNECP